MIVAALDMFPQGLDTLFFLAGCNGYSEPCVIQCSGKLDHFRAFAEYYSIPCDAENASAGKWVEGPGMKLFDALEKALGKKNFEDASFGLVVKRPGKPTLVPESDKRPPYSPAEAAFQAVTPDG